MNTPIETCLNILEKETYNNEEYVIYKQIKSDKKGFIFGYLDWLRETGNNINCSSKFLMGNINFISDYDAGHSTTFCYDMVGDGGFCLSKLVSELDEYLKAFNPNFTKIIENNKNEVSFGTIANLSFKLFKRFVDEYDIDFDGLCPVIPNYNMNSTFIDYVVQAGKLKNIQYCYDKGLFPPNYDVFKWGKGSSDLVLQFYKAKGIVYGKFLDYCNSQINGAISDAEEELEFCVKILEILKKIKNSEKLEISIDDAKWLNEKNILF